MYEFILNYYIYFIFYQYNFTNLMHFHNGANCFKCPPNYHQWNNMLQLLVCYIAMFTVMYNQKWVQSNLRIFAIDNLLFLNKCNVFI